MPPRHQDNPEPSPSAENSDALDSDPDTVNEELNKMLRPWASIIEKDSDPATRKEMIREIFERRRIGDLSAIEEREFAPCSQLAIMLLLVELIEKTGEGLPPS